MKYYRIVKGTEIIGLVEVGGIFGVVAKLWALKMGAHLEEIDEYRYAIEVRDIEAEEAAGRGQVA